MRRFTRKELALFLAPLLVIAARYGANSLPGAWRRHQLAHVEGLRSILPCDGVATGMLFTPDGSTFITGETRKASGRMPRLSFRDARTGKLKFESAKNLPAATSELYPESLTLDGRAFRAWADSDHVLLDVSTGKLIDNGNLDLNDPLGYRDSYFMRFPTFVTLHGTGFGLNIDFWKVAFAPDRTLGAAITLTDLFSGPDHLMIWRNRDRKLISEKSIFGIHGENLAKLRGKDVADLAFTPDGRILLFSGELMSPDSFHRTRGLFAFAANMGKLLWSWTGPIAGLAVSPDGKCVAGRSALAPELFLLDPATGRIRATRSIDDSMRTGAEGGQSLLFSPDGKTLALRGRREYYFFDVASFPQNQNPG